MQIIGSPTLLDLVIVDMPEDSIAPIILGRPFLRNIKAFINLYEGNVRIELPSRDLFVFISPGKRRSRSSTMGSSF